MERAIQGKILIHPEALLFGSLLCVLQALDGFLTTMGVHRFGVEVEANPVIRYLMISLGEIPALALIKMLALSAIIILMFMAQRVNWISKAMGIVAALYIVVAILPWTYILFIRDLI